MMNRRRSKAGDLKVVSIEPKKVDKEERVDEEDPKNLFSKFVKVIGQSTSSVWKASKGDLKASSDLKVVFKKPNKVFVEEEEVDDEYPNLLMKVVKVIGKGTRGVRLVYEPEPALNLATYRGDRHPFALWCVRGSGLFCKYAFFKMKFYLGLSLMVSGVGALIVLGDKYDELEASDSDSD